jgi:hypothetical protein
VLHETAHRVFEGLKSRGLAVESEDGVSIRMHPPGPQARCVYGGHGSAEERRPSPAIAVRVSCWCQLDLPEP